MQITRSILAVVVGYLIFAVSAFAFFQITGVAPHKTASLLFMIGSDVFGAMFATLGGYVAARIAKRAPVAHGIAVAVVLAVGASVSLISTVGKGAIWSQVAALFLMSPCAVFGGWLSAKKASMKEDTIRLTRR